MLLLLILLPFLAGCYEVSPHDNHLSRRISPPETPGSARISPRDAFRSGRISRCTTCSTRIQCQVEGDNFLERRAAAHECSCLTFCAETASCTWYTWFNGRDPDDPKSCYLFSSCDSTLDCPECFSGPPICPSTTTPITTSTVTTTPNSNPTEVIFIAGGLNRGTTELLDITGSSLPATSSLPDSRHFHTSHFLPHPPSSNSITTRNSTSSLPSLESASFGSILICGGEHKPNFTRHSCIATTDPVSGHWQKHSTTIRERYRHSGALAGGTVHLLAGITANRTTEFWNNGNWTLGSEMPHKPGGGSCAASSSPTTIIVSGGTVVILGWYRKLRAEYYISKKGRQNQFQ